MTQLLVDSAAHRHAAHFDRKWVSVVALCAALGLAFVAVADVGNRHGHTATSVFFWLGLLLIFVPIAFGVLREHADRQERLMFIILLGVALYLVKVLVSPNAFVFTDEFIHLRNTQDILHQGHLFEFNPLLPTAAYYPGLAAVTAGLADLTGLSPFASGVLIIGAARVLFSACFFLVAEKVTGSGRAAAGASLVYAANPLFLFWAAAFSYENLALPLAAFVVWWLGRTRHGTGRLAQTVTAIAIVAVSVTHHVAGLALTALLGAWWLAECLTERPTALPRQRSRTAQRRVGLMTIVAGTTTLAWFLFTARPAASYLFTNNVLPALRQTGSVLLGRIPSRDLYASGGYDSPAWESLAGVAAVGVLLLLLPPALYQAWGHRDRAPMAVAIGVAAVFPLSLVPRLAPDGVAISGRSAAYVFAGLGCVIALLVEEAAWRRRRPGGDHATRAARVGWHRTAVATGLVTLVFVGSVTIGTAFYQRLPEASHPQGYPWSVQADVVSASEWARDHLGSNQRFGANAIDALALATYGEQHTVEQNSIWPVFFAEEMNKTVVRSIRATGVLYLFVDSRMTKGLPPTPGYYVSPQEPHAREYSRLFPAAALQKFDSAACTDLVYDSGAVKIFDVSRIENGSCEPGLAGAPRDEGVPR